MLNLPLSTLVTCYNAHFYFSQLCITNYEEQIFPIYHFRRNFSDWPKPRDGNRLKCKIIINNKDDAKDGLLSKKKSETRNWNIAVVEDGDNDEDENYTGEILSFLRKGKF